MSATNIGIIDTHCHLWRLEVSGETWVTPELGLLHRSFEPDDIVEASQEVGVASFVVVEAGKTPEENRTLEEMADSPEAIGAIMPHADLESADLEKELDYWRRVPKFRGVRMGLEGHPDPGILARPSIQAGLAAVAQTGHGFEFLVRTHHLKDVLKVYDKVPDLRGIIDHMAKPDMVDRTDRDDWQKGMSALARNTDLRCKISLSPRGEDIPRRAKNPGKGWSADAIKPFVQHLLDEFGPERLIWGSDWPIALVTSDYDGTYRAMRDAIGPLRPEDEARMFSTNAAQFYRLQAQRPAP